MLDLNFRMPPALNRGAGGSFALAAAAVLILTAGLSPAMATPQTGSSSAPSSKKSPTVDRSGKVQTGVASFYGKPREHAGTTASGAPMDPSKLTAASRTLPLGTKARVINKDNGRSTAVTITDRGPYAKNRILDVSPRAAAKLGMTNDGVSKVKVVPVQEPAPGTKSDAAAR